MTLRSSPAGDSTEASTASSQPSRQLGTNGPDVHGAVAAARQQVRAKPERNEAGRYLPENPGAMGAGDTSRQLQAALAPLRDAVATALLSDLGYTVEDAPRTVLMAARDLASLDVLAETFWCYLQERGCVTAKGKATAAVAKFLAVIDRKSKVIGMLGLERKARPVRSLAEEMADV